MERHTFAHTRQRTVRGNLALILLVVGIFPASLPADDRGAATAAPNGAQSFDDLKVSLQARKALQQDKRLEGLNVGVTVQKGVASLWGPVPSAEVAAEAVRRLEKVRGITRVIDQSKVVPPEDPLPAQVAEALRAQGIQAPIANAPTSITTAKVAQPRPDVFPVPAKPARTTALRQADVPKGPVVLLRPEPAQPAPKAVTVPTSFDAGWEQLRARDRRFRDVTLASEGGVVRINGTVDRMADAWDLAERLADFPGVKQVQLGNVEAR